MGKRLFCFHVAQPVIFKLFQGAFLSCRTAVSIASGVGNTFCLEAKD